MDKLDSRQLEQVRALRADQTPAERALWAELRGKRFAGTKWRRQVPWHGYAIDFYCAKLKIAVEVDGLIHDDPEQARRDHFKQLSLERAGIFVIRVTNEDVFSRLSTVLERIRTAVEDRSRRWTSAPGSGGV